MTQLTNPLPVRTRPLYRAEYEALGAQGFFEDENVELIEGQLVLAAEEGPDHAEIVRRVIRLLIESIPEEVGTVGVGNPLSVNDLSVPQPDAFVAAPGRNYRAGHPRTSTLVIEVAHASRAFDLGVKAAVYAAAGIPDYWVVDLSRDEIVVHRDPVPRGFDSITRHAEGVLHALHHEIAVDVPALLR